MKLSRKQADLIQCFCDENDYDLRKNYSGRFMYGEKCIGIVGTGSLEIGMKLIIYLFNESEEDLANTFSKNCNEDNMGRQSIVYFPSIQWDGENEENEEE